MCTSYSNLKPHWERNRKDHCVGYELQLPTLYALIRAGACCESGSVMMNGLYSQNGNRDQLLVGEKTQERAAQYKLLY